VVVAAAGPLSYASLGDYSRRISPRRHRDRAVLGAAALGVGAGLLVPTVFGAYTAASLDDPAGDYVLGLVAAAPAWYVVPILLVGLAGSVGQGALNLYATGLDLESLAPRLRRLHTTLISSAVAVALVFAGTFLVDAVDAITAMTLVLNAVAAPWVGVLLVGLVARRGRYHAADLQRFGRGRGGGRYWFRGGVNPRALLAWAAGSAFGLLAVATSLYTGPLANLAGGVDLSLAGSFAIAAAVYAAALAVSPEVLR
jgi:purine-cytosine permease-like protein